MSFEALLLNASLEMAIAAAPAARPMSAERPDQLPERVASQ